APFLELADIAVERGFEHGLPLAARNCVARELTRAFELALDAIRQPAADEPLVFRDGLRFELGLRRGRGSDSWRLPIELRRLRWRGFPRRAAQLELGWRLGWLLHAREHALDLALAHVRRASRQRVDALIIEHRSELDERAQIQAPVA